MYSIPWKIYIPQKWKNRNIGFIIDNQNAFVVLLALYNLNAVLFLYFKTLHDANVLYLKILFNIIEFLVA